MILVVIEVRDGKVKKYSLEALAEGKRRADDLNSDVRAVLIGHGQDALAPDLFRYGASTVYLLDSPLLSRYSPTAFAEALATLLGEIKPQILFFPASAMGKDLAPRVAARLGVALASDGIQTAINNGRLEVLRPIFAGKALLTVGFEADPQIATLRPNVFPLPEPREATGQVVKREIPLAEASVKAQVQEVLRPEGAAVDVTEAEIVVSGGRGMKAPENFDLLRDLAAVLPRASVGASRSAVDSAWIDHQHQVGQTGKTVSPQLYLAFGISGAIQHVAGMSSSKVIVAVNKDPEAPIFKIADLGVVGDLFQIIPALKEELKKALAD